MGSVVPIDEWNAETPLAGLTADPTATDLFYTRSNFGVPDVAPSLWQLSVGGLVDHRGTFTLEGLQQFGSTTTTVTVECAGNGRTLMTPVPEGTAWGLGAVSVGAFTGVPLSTVLDVVGVSESVVEVVFTGIDRGVVEPEGEVNFAFSLDAAAARGDGPLLAWGLNGDPLPRKHGGPLRLVVPGYYGMCSVKWLADITAIDAPFEGHFRKKYRYLGDPLEDEGARVGPIRVRSLITSPQDGAAVDPSVHVKGIAWSGDGSIESVKIRIDDGEWADADLASPADPHHAPVEWSATVSLSTGRHEIAVRATDASGAAQPEAPVWNGNGYANNVIHRVGVLVGDSSH